MKSRLMFNKNRIVSNLMGLGLLLALTANNSMAQKDIQVEMVSLTKEQSSQFQKIEQPLGLKIFIALSGLGLIGAELWWFIFAKARK